MRKKNQKTIGLYLLPALLMVIVILYFPIFINLFESFFNWGAMSSKHEFVGIANYLKMFEDKVFYVALKNNLIFTVMSVICQIGISLVIASVLEKVYEKGAELFSVCILHPIAFDGDGCGNYIQDDLQPIYRIDQPAPGTGWNRYVQY